MPQRALIIATGSKRQEETLWSRYFRFKAGATPEDIAKVDGVDVETVNSAIQSAETYRQAHSLESTNTSVGQTITSVMPTVTEALKRGLTKKTKRRAKNGRFVTEHDMAMQMRAVSEVTGLVQSIQPKGNKGGDMIIDNSNKTAIGIKTFSEDHYQPGFEERIDAIRARVSKQNLLPREVGTPDDPDADPVVEDEDDSVVVSSASSEDAQETAADHD